MTNSRNHLTILIRAAITGEIDSSVDFKGTDWEKIYRTSVDHQVLPQLFDGIQLLKESQYSPQEVRPTLLKLIATRRT